MKQNICMSDNFSFPNYPAGANPFQNADVEGTREFITNLHQRNFLLRDIGVSSYLFNQWKNYGLLDLPVSAQGRKWVTLNFGEYIWLKIINDLRKLGCSLEDIKKVKERYMIDPLRQHMEQNQIEVFNQLFWAAAKQFGNQTEEQMEEMKKELAKINPIDLVKEVFPRPMNMFEGCIFNMITTRSDAYLVLFLLDYFPQSASVSIPENKPEIETEKKRKRKAQPNTIEFGLFSDEFRRIDPNSIWTERIYDVPHIKIPLRVYIRDFIADNKNEKHVEALGMLNKEELLLLKEVRKKNVKEITIRFKQLGNTEKSAIERIEITNELKKDAETRLIETFTCKEYADITYKIENGKIVSFKKTIKIKPAMKE